MVLERRIANKNKRENFDVRDHHRQVRAKPPTGSHDRKVVQSFIDRNELTARRSLEVFRLHQELTSAENNRRFELLLTLPEKLLLAATRDPFSGRGAEDDSHRDGPISTGKYGHIALPGVYLGGWGHDDAEMGDLLEYRRFLIWAGQMHVYFYLHATYIPEHGVVWDWRDIHRIGKEHQGVFMPCLLVVRFAMNQVIRHEIPAVHKRAISERAYLKTQRRFSESGEMMAYERKI